MEKNNNKDMTLLDRLKTYIKHNFSMQKFTDYKTLENQIVTGDLEIGKQLLDLESMTPVDGEVIIDNQKVKVEKGIVTAIEDYIPVMEEDMEKTECADVEVEVCGECGEGEDCSCDTESMPQDTPMEMEVIAPVEGDGHMKEMMDTIDLLKSEIDSLKSEIETLKSEKMKMSSEMEELANKPVQEVFKAVEPIKNKMNSRESLLRSLREVKNSIE